MYFVVGFVLGFGLGIAGMLWIQRACDNQPAKSSTSLLLPQLTGWVDYDRPQLSALTPMERVDYLEKRVRLVVIQPLKRILDTEIQPTSDSSALLIFGVSLCCTIEALGKFLIGGRPGAGVRFDAFLARYLRADFTSKSLVGDSYGRILWKHYRNGLAHGFAVKHGGFEGSKGKAYFVVRANALMLNPYGLFDDFTQGFEQYITDLRASGGKGQLFSDFDHVFDDVFIKGN